MLVGAFSVIVKTIGWFAALLCTLHTAAPGRERELEQFPDLVHVCNLAGDREQQPDG